MSEEQMREHLKKIIRCAVAAFKEIQTESGMQFSSGDIARLAISLFIQTGRMGFTEHMPDKETAPHQGTTDEQPSPAPKNGQDTESVLIRFGKHKGENLIDVFKRDRGYVVWLSQNARNEKVRSASQTLLTGVIH